jgi:nucleosome binding factor SPN SPT16 subunit
MNKNYGGTTLKDYMESKGTKTKKSPSAKDKNIKVVKTKSGKIKVKNLRAEKSAREHKAMLKNIFGS